MVLFLLLCSSDLIGTISSISTNRERTRRIRRAAPIGFLDPIDWYIISSCPLFLFRKREIGKEREGEREKESERERERERARERARLCARGGGLGSRPIFKKFHETYAPS